MDDPTRPRGLTALRAILLFSLASTTLHYSHNTFAIDQYPPVPGISDTISASVVAFGWVVFTIAGFIGYRMFVRRRFLAAHGWLLFYSLSGVASLGHFLVGALTIPAFWYATVFTDGIAAILLWGFVVWSAAVQGEGARARQAVSR